MIKKLFFFILLGFIFLNINNCEKKVVNMTPSSPVEEKISPPVEKKALPPQEPATQEPAPKIFENGIEEENISED